MTNAIKYLLDADVRGAILLLSRDSDLQEAVAAWPAVRVSIRSGRRKLEIADPPTLDAAVRAAWDGAEVDPDSLIVVFGSEQRGQRIVKRAAAFGLIFPDGTVHPMAAAMVAGLTKQALSASRGRAKR